MIDLCSLQPVNYTGQFMRNIVLCLVTETLWNTNIVSSYSLVDKDIEGVKDENYLSFSLFSICCSIIYHNPFSFSKSKLVRRQQIGKYMYMYQQKLSSRKYFRIFSNSAEI